VGFDPVDAGPLGIARYTESFALLVGQLAYEGKGGPELAYRFERFGWQRGEDMSELAEWESFYVIVGSAAGALIGLQAFGTLSVGNGVVFIGYQDGKGTMVALDAESGRKLFEFHNQIKLADGSVMRSGAVEGGPQVVDNMVYWGVGAESGGLFTNRDGVNVSAGSRIFGFELKHDREERSE